MQILKRLFGLNAAAVYGISAKVLNGLSWLMIAVAVSTFLSKTDQGYFFTFLSLATAQMLFDLGLGTAIIQFVAHEWAALSVTPDKNADSAAASRLKSVMRFAITWYGLGGLALLTVLLFLGWYFFHTAEATVWPGAWNLLCVTVSCDFALLAFWNVLEGCNKVRHVYAYRALKTLIFGIAVWGAILYGAGLYALGIGYLATLPVSIGMLTGKSLTLLRWIWRRQGDDRVDWRREIMPLQWRLAVSFGSGYFAQWGITPIAFKLFGPVVAGQFGMVWSMINAITAVASVIVMVRAPQYGMLIASRKYDELDKLALRISLLSVGAAFAGCCLTGVGVYALNLVGSPYAERVLPLGPTITMLVAAALWQIVNPLAVYLRSHKREPYLWLSFSFAVGMVVSTFVFGRLWGEWGVTLSYLLLVACFFVPGAVIIFLRCRDAWHSSFAAGLDFKR
jgi:O-antigen/teichoic acid export membrane protein